MGEIVGMLITLTARVLTSSAGFARLHAPEVPELGSNPISHPIKQKSAHRGTLRKEGAPRWLCISINNVC